MSGINLEQALKKCRLENQKIRNAQKPKLISDDVRETSDFNFYPIKPCDRVGDSGNLLLAKRIKDNHEQYLIKHEYCDCAANEYVYSKLALAMGLHVPESRLFFISGDKNSLCFKSGYVVGARYLNIKDDNPSYKKICKCAFNWKEYYSFITLYHLFIEGDGFELVLADDGFVYRVDTTDSFPISEYLLSMVGIDMETPAGSIQDIAKKQIIESCIKQDYWRGIDLTNTMQRSIEKYGLESRQGFLDPLYRIQDISETYIDDFLNTLCYFYPDFIGDCYKNFIIAAQEKARNMLGLLK